MVLLALLVLAATGLWFGIHPFLAVTKKVDANVLVIEGWVAQAAIREAVWEFDSGHYELVFTTGGPIDKGSPYSSKYNTYAHHAFSRLQNAGLPRDVLRRIPAREHDRDRTYSAALALRHWFESNEMALPDRINVLSDGAHARRSRLLFEKAFGREVEIGIIAAPPSDYPAERWWQYSSGVRAVVSETAGYVYARVIFRADPDKAPADFAAPDGE